MSHYSIHRIDNGIDTLKSIFPDGEANEMNFVLFSTSGVHGCYTTIEQIESGLKKYGDTEIEDWPDDYCGDELTVLIVQPRLVCLQYSSITITLDDIEYLKKLRKSSREIVQIIGG